MNFLRKVKSLLQKGKLDAEMSAEMQAHVDLQTERNVASGMNAEDARYAALRQFGNVASLQEQARAQRSWVWLEQFGQDLRHGIRVLAKNRGFTAFALLTLALGIGANTAIFSVANSVLWRALPVPRPAELVFLSDPEDRGGLRGGIHTGNRDLLTFPEFQYLQEHNAVFTGLVATTLRGGDVVVANPGQADSHGPAFQSLVNGDYFSVLGVSMVLGRGFTPQIDRVRDANPVAVISHAFWQERFGGDPQILGRVIRINDAAFEIVGVAQPGFAGDTVGWPVGVWLPLSMQAKAQPGRDLLSPSPDPRANWRWLGVMGRLKPGVNLTEAQANIDVVFRQFLESQLAALPPAQLAAVPKERQAQFFDQHIALAEGSRGGSTLRTTYRKPLVVLLGLVGLLLLSAGANLANLMLARAARRQKEIAMRVALGAKASRVFRQLLTESLLLAGLGGALGLLLAYWGNALLMRLVTQNSAPVHTDARVMGFALGISLLIGILFGTAPAVQAWRVDLNTILKGTGEGPGRRRGIPLAKLLVVVQVALSLPLLVVAGLFVHSFQKLVSVDLGYDRNQLLLVAADVTGYKGAALGQFYRDLGGRLRTLPGVEGVAVSANGLLTGRANSYRIAIEGYVPPAGQAMNPTFDHVGPGYFATVGIPVLRGREITAGDAGAAQRVGVINQTMARDYFGDTDPLGRQITVNFNTAPGVSTPYPFVVAGVVADAKYNNVREKPQPFYYLPIDNPVGGPASQLVEAPMCIVRTTGNPAPVVAAIRALVKEASPNAQPSIRTVNERLEGTLGLDRALMGFSGFFGGLATLLVGIGIYGIMSYAVARRTREIGIRLAIGAQGSRVLRLVLGDSFRLVFAGVVLGVIATLAAGKFVASFLFGLTPADPLVLGAAIVLMFLLSGLAAYFPARRAAKVDPVIALRAE